MSEKDVYRGVELFKNKFSLKDYKDVFFQRETPSAILQMKHAKLVLKQLTGKVIEIGASPWKPYFRDFAINAKEYIRTNMYPPNQDFLKLDATNIDLEDNSVDGIICMNVLEHIYDFHKALDEFYRVLKPDGKLIVSNPFLFEYHGAPDDYCRFTHSFYKEKMKNYKDLQIYQIGNRFSMIAHQLQAKDFNGVGRKTGILSRSLALLFLKISIFFTKPDDMALNYTVIGTKQSAEKIKAVWENSFQKHLQIFEKSAVVNELNQDSICIDAGANVGVISHIFASKGAKVYAFEPNPTAFQELQKNATGNMCCYQQAVWDKNTKINLYMYEFDEDDPLFWSQGASMFNTKILASKDNYVEVEAIDLIEFIEKLNKPIDVLKMDIEGAEYDILLKLINTNLYQNIRHILVETHLRSIPELKDKAKIVDHLIKEKNIVNIDLDWV